MERFKGDQGLTEIGIIAVAVLVAVAAVIILFFLVGH